MEREPDKSWPLHNGVEDVHDTLNDRGKEYGDYVTMSDVIQNIKDAMRASPNWCLLPAYMKESLELQATKVGRILCGNYNKPDSWHDIQGYARLVEERLAPITPNVGAVTIPGTEAVIADIINQPTLDQSLGKLSIKAAE